MSKLEYNSRPLSSIELRIVQLARQGKANKEIAYQLNLAEGTVRAYLNRVFRLIRVRNRTDLISWEGDLSPRERQIVKLVRQGKPTKEIARELNIAEGTVRAYLTDVFRKLGIKGKRELIINEYIDLSPREMQIVDLVRQGKQNKEIAYELCLASGTVSSYLHRIFQKTGVRNRTELARFSANVLPLRLN